RVGDVATDLEDAVRVRIGQIVDFAVEAAVRRAFALPEHGAHVFAQQRIRETIEALAIDREPAAAGLAIGDRHRPSRGAQAGPVERYPIDVPGFGDEPRHDEVFRHRTVRTTHRGDSTTRDNRRMTSDPVATDKPAAIGWVDEPAGASVGPRVRVAGWALAAARIREVQARFLDTAVRARYGLPREDVAAVRPGYP